MEVGVLDDLKKNILNKRLTAVGLVIGIIVKFSIVAYGASWYSNNSSVLSNNSVILDGARWISWNIAKFACILADVCEGLYDKTFGFIDVTNYSAINDIVSRLQPVLVALTCLCIVGLGIVYMVMQDRKPIVRNILVAALVVSCSTYMFTTANSLIKSFKGDILGDSSAGQSYEIINNNLLDLIAIDKQIGINSLNYEGGNGVIHNAGVKNKRTMNEINYLEVLNYSDKKKGQDIYGWGDPFNNYISKKAIRVGGQEKTVDVESGFLGTTIGNEFYYRYSFDFWSAMLQLGAIILMYVALSYKNIRIAYELVVSRILAYMYSADIGNGERLKQILFFIRDTYIALCVSILSVKLFSILTEAMTSFGITGLAKGLVSIFIAYAVIDGPNLVERILGVDAGLSSSVGRTMAVLGMAKTAVRGGKNTASGVGKIAMAGATGKTAYQRLQERAGGSIPESFAVKLRNGNRQKGNQNKSFDSFMQGNTKTSVTGNRVNNSGYTDFMSDEGKKEYQNGHDNSDSGVITLHSNLNNDNIHSHSDYNVTPFSSSAEDVDVAKVESKISSSINNSHIASSTQSIEHAKISNPVFAETVRNLAPGKGASVGERRDFNRQVNNIVRGDHKAIKPEKGARADYRFSNYKKALKIEKAYNIGKVNNRGGDNNG